MPLARSRARLLGAIALAVVGFAGGPGAGVAATHPAPPRPNFLLVLVDDQALNSFTPAYQPRTFRWIVDPGTDFTAGLAAPPLCCPDRAGILTGDYPHNNGVFSNVPGYGSLTDKGDTLPVWLHRAGYRTGFVGKFLNNYLSAAGYSVAPGFDFWFAYDDPTRYFNYTVSDQGTPHFFGNDRRDYSTSVFTREALKFLRQPGRRPWFLWLAYNAPHDSHVPSPHCNGLDPTPATSGAYLRYARVPLPTPPSYDEADTSDKPQAIASLPPIDAPHAGFLARRFRCTLAAMKPVDAGIDGVMHALRHRGELRRTIVLYLSDNGYYFGEHRIQFGKSWPYEPALRVPFAIRVPGALRRRGGPAARPTVGRVVSEQDVAPTLLDYAGGAFPCASATDCRRIDGRSLRPLLGGGGAFPGDRGILSELNDSTDGIHYSAIRTRRYMYAEYADGERELYDLRIDPDELQNVITDPAYAGIASELAARLAALRQCSGHDGPSPCE